MNLWHRLIDIPSIDPDESRRSRLLNIILVMLEAAVVVTLVAYIVSVVSTESVQAIDPGYRLLMAVTSALVMLVVIYWVGRRWSARLASALLLVLLTVLITVSDDTFQLIQGRSVINYVLPIILAGVLIRPSASLVSAGLIILLHAWLAQSIQEPFNFPTAALFMVVALVAWLATQGLEQALKELRLINQELDQRVADRTRELNLAYERERADAGKRQAILQSIADGVVVFDAEGQTIIANPALAQLTGQQTSDMSGLAMDEWIQLVTPQAQQATLQALFEMPGEAPLNVDWDAKILSVSVSPVSLDSGENIGKVAVFHDVTREVEVSRMKSAFVAMVSHDLRSPLNAILGLVEILQHHVHGPLNEKQQDLIVRVMSNAQRLKHLVDDLLDQAQIEAGKVTIHKAAFFPQDLLDGQQELVAPAAQSKDLALSFYLDPALPDQLVGDIHRLNQILNNLVTNAVKFTERGQVRVRCYQQDAGHWALEVSDTGIGIPNDALPHIFEPFYQVSNALVSKRGGTGLGLSIVSRLVEIMGGEIRLDSQEGQGSTFTVVFPLVLPEPAPLEPVEQE
ncbi:MAG: PAS domain-containing sensor histidine kinase [Chloroflexota bacterium]